VERNKLVERQVLVATQQEPGCIIGECACLLGGARTATVKAATECRMFVIQKSAIDRVIDEHPEILEEVLKVVGERRDVATRALSEAGAYEGLKDEVGGTIGMGDGPDGDAGMSQVELMNLFISTKNQLEGLDVKEEGEEYVAQIESMFNEVAKSRDWRDGSGPVNLLNHVQKVFEKFQSEEEHVHRMAPEGYEVEKLENQINRIINVQKKAETDLPDSPRTKGERNLRHHINVRVCKTQLQYVIEAMRSATLESKYKTMSSLCAYVDETNPRIVQEMEDSVEAFRAPLIAQHGEEMGNRLFDSLLEWKKRKEEGWTTCHTMLGRTRHMGSDIKRLKAKVKRDPEGGKSEDKKAIALLEQNRNEAMNVESKVNQGLTAMNKRILKSCFIDSPPLPESCVAASPLLSLALHLQSIVEAKEDYRVAISIILRTANCHMLDTISAALTLSESDNKPTTEFSEDIWNFDRTTLGEKGITPDMVQYVEGLGEWLYAKNAKKWDIEAEQIALRESMGK